jgi:hypothetical protein
MEQQQHSYRKMVNRIADMASARATIIRITVNHEGKAEMEIFDLNACELCFKRRQRRYML